MKKNKIFISIALIVCCVLIGGIGTLNQHNLSLKTNTVKASSTKTNYIPTSKKTYTNSSEDKEALLNLMINSIQYFNTAEGNFSYFSKNAETDMDVNFIVDLNNNKSYEQNTFKNSLTRSNENLYEESIFNGEYYMTFTNNNLNENNSSKRANQESQFHYVKINIPKTEKQSKVPERKISDMYLNYNGEKIYNPTQDNAYMGISKTLLLPQDIAIGFMGTDYSKWAILSNSMFLDRNAIIIESQLNDYYQAKHNSSKASIIVDSETGILLQIVLKDDNENDTFRITMNNLELNNSVNQQTFDKYIDYIDEEEN